MRTVELLLLRGRCGVHTAITAAAGAAERAWDCSADSDRRPDVRGAGGRLDLREAEERGHRMMQMRWLRVPDWPRYTVSECGHVFDGHKQCLVHAKQGESQIWLLDEGKTFLRVNPGSLVLMAFVGPKPEGKERCHRDDDPHNNCLDNLYWGTRAQNVADYIRNGRRDHIFGENAQRVILTEEQVLEAARLRASDPRTYTWSTLGQIFGVSGSTVHKAVKGANWPHLQPQIRAIMRKEAV